MAKLPDNAIQPTVEAIYQWREDKAMPARPDWLAIEKQVSKKLEEVK